MDTRGKTYTYEIEEKDGGIYKGTKDEAIEEFKKEMFIKYNRIDPSPEIEYIVKEIIINSIIQIENNMSPIEDIPMKQATQLDYNIIDEYKDFLQNNGTCVIDNFIGMYGEKLKITRDNFIDMCKEYYKQYNINWTWIRPCFIYGPNDVKTRLIPRLINKFINNENITLDECNSTLDYLYVEDFVEYIYQLTLKKSIGIYNLCSGNEYKLKDIINLIKSLTNSSSEIVFDKNINRGVSFNYVCGNNEKIKLCNIFKLIKL
jgi:hypothetical protein